MRQLPRALAVAALLAGLAAVAAAFLAGAGDETAPRVEMVASPSGPDEPPAGPAAAPPPLQRGNGSADRPRRRSPGAIRWRDSAAIGSHSAGRLERGVLLPPRGRGWLSWDPIMKRSPNRAWRRWGSDRLVRATLQVLRGFRRSNPGAPRVAIGDLSRPRGGDFGPRFGSIGHASHQNGLDVDVYYPRLDRRLRPPDGADQVNLKLAQKLVDGFVEAGAETVFVGPSLGLGGPPDVVVPLVNHDNHLHARFPPDR